MSADGRDTAAVLQAVGENTNGLHLHARTRPALFLSAVLLVGLVPAFILLVPAPSLSPIFLLGALLALSLIGSLRGVVFRKEDTPELMSFDAGGAASLLMLALFGPLLMFAADLVWAVTTWRTQGHRFVPFLSNVASAGWGALAAGATYIALSGGASWGQPSSASAYLALGVAGLVYYMVNYSVGLFVIVGVLDRRSVLATARREYLNLPPALPIILLALGTLILYSYVGILALAAFAVIVLVPQLVLPALLRPRPVENLSHADAVVLYSQAIASVLKLDSTMKEVLSDAAQHIEGPEAQANGGKIKATYSGEHFHDVVEAVLYYREHWDSGGEGFAGVGGEMIPLSSRILAVSDQWAQLTASGVWTVTHAQAMNKLQEHSGTEYDPRIVAAAVKVVDEERMGLTDNQPQLHEVPLPQLVRKVPRLSGLLTANRTGA